MCRLGHLLRDGRDRKPPHALKTERVQPMALGRFFDLQLGTADVRRSSSWESGGRGEGFLDAKFFLLKNIYLFIFMYLFDCAGSYLQHEGPSIFVVACRIFSCSMKFLLDVAYGI